MWQVTSLLLLSRVSLSLQCGDNACSRGPLSLSCSECVEFLGYSCIYHVWGVFSQIICLLLYFSSPSGTPTICILVYLGMSQRSLRFCSFILCSLFLLFLRLASFFNGSSFTLTDSSACSNMLLNPSSEFSISVTVHFISRISFWCSFYNWLLTFCS